MVSELYLRVEIIDASLNIIARSVERRCTGLVGRRNDKLYFEVVLVKGVRICSGQPKQPFTLGTLRTDGHCIWAVLLSVRVFIASLLFVPKQPSILRESGC